jgi:hypothetical protein
MMPPAVHSLMRALDSPTLGIRQKEISAEMLAKLP